MSIRGKERRRYILRCLAEKVREDASVDMKTYGHSISSRIKGDLLAPNQKKARLGKLLRSISENWTF